MKLILMTFVLFLTISGKSQAQMGVWKDSLNVRIADSVVLKDQSGDHYLHFAVVAERVNKVWDNNDTILGDCDFYFGYNPEAFADGASPEITWVNDSLWGGGKGSPLACYSVNSKKWADRLLIDITKRDNISNTYIYKLRLPYAQVDTLCKVRWKLRVVTGPSGTNAMAARLGIDWDPGATGLQSSGGNPIIENLQGDVIKNPLPFINLDWPAILPAVCEGEPAEVGVTAETTGDDNMLSFVWYDSIPGGTWRRIDSVNTPTAVKTHTTYPVYSYSFRGKGDTLYVPQVTGQMDSIFFRCVAVDASISASAWTDPMQQLVRDRIHGFMAPEDGSLTKNFVDTVSMCPGSKVPVRFYIYGTTKEELVELDSIYFHYVSWQGVNPGPSDTVVFKARDRKILSGKTINGYPVFYWTYNLDTVGQYNVNSIWTKYCHNASVDLAYDTLYIKTGNYQILEKLTLLISRTPAITDTVAVVFKGDAPDKVYNTRIGHTGEIDPVYDLGDAYVKYRADSVGFDTIRYEYDAPGKCSWWRPIEVQDLKYISIKVMLEGPYISSTGKMRSLLLTSTNLNNNNFGFPKNNMKSHFMSPYNDKDSIEINQFRNMIKKKELVGVKFADWIYVKLKETSAKTAPYVDSLTGLLREDGVICDTAGNPYLGFKNIPSGGQYVVIQHRNHLPIMSANAVVLSNTPALAVTNLIDMTQMNLVYDKDRPGRPDDCLKLINGVGCMYAGEFNKDRIINVADVNIMVTAIATAIARTSGYHLTDVNFDRIANAADLNIFFPVNRNKTQDFYSE